MDSSESRPAVMSNVPRRPVGVLPVSSPPPGAARIASAVSDTVRGEALRVAQTGPERS
jgi:hypothetical protein